MKMANRIRSVTDLARTLRPIEWFGGFALMVIIVSIAVLGWQIETRTDAIQTINDAAQRIEQVATNSEQILLDAQADRNSPERQQFNQEVREAVREINEVKMLLCSSPEIDNPEICAPTG
jgi:cell division protein FtsX